jgi:hypothetical protein
MDGRRFVRDIAFCFYRSAPVRVGRKADYTSVWLAFHCR